MESIPKKIVWLASYPKSGNTWFRAFITALLNNGEVNINDLRTDGIFASRTIFDYYSDLDSTYLTQDEVKLLQPSIFSDLAKESIDKEKVFIKIHDAYTFNKKNTPIVPTSGSLCAIYIIRNPLDIVASLANHISSSIDEAIDLMNDIAGSLANQKGNNNISRQTSQLLLDWSGHVSSWTEQKKIPVFVIRYEDMLQNTLNTFEKCCKFIGIEAEKGKIEQAIKAASFKELRSQEVENKFVEKKGGKFFFRQGELGLGASELTKEQKDTIVQCHSQTMKQFNYI